MFIEHDQKTIQAIIVTRKKACRRRKIIQACFGKSQKRTDAQIVGGKKEKHSSQRYRKIKNRTKKTNQ